MKNLHIFSVLLIAMLASGCGADKYDEEVQKAVEALDPVSYTHLTLPTKLEV